jgi:hypothetical protein
MQADLLNNNGDVGRRSPLEGVFSGGWDVIPPFAFLDEHLIAIFRKMII